jgi:8-oxo-dGTP diphosphatase
MARPPEIKNRTSSGGIIFRSAGGQQLNRAEDIEVAIISVKGGKAWCLPKGIIDKGEDPPTAALREVREETGLRGEIIDKIGRISYWYYLKEEAARVHKTVHFFLMKYLDGNTDDHDHEVDDARWYRIQDAVLTLSYKSEKEIMRKAHGMIENILTRSRKCLTD